MSREWPFFRSLLSNIDMILAKTDLSIARHYANLVEDRALADRIFGVIEAEHKRSIDALEKILGKSSLN